MFRGFCKCLASVQETFNLRIFQECLESSRFHPGYFFSDILLKNTTVDYLVMHKVSAHFKLLYYEILCMARYVTAMTGDILVQVWQFDWCTICPETYRIIHIRNALWNSGLQSIQTVECVYTNFNLKKYASCIWSKTPKGTRNLPCEAMAHSPQVFIILQSQDKIAFDGIVMLRSHERVAFACSLSYCKI